MATSTRTSFCLGRASQLTGALLLFGLPAWANVGDAPQVLSTISGTAVVVDGDTIDIDGQRIRLEGIDAPETKQTCVDRAGVNWPCGRAAARALQILLTGNDVSCDSTGNDKYGRFLGVCYVAGQDANAAMINAGLAWAFVKYSNRYVAQEAHARASRTGVWEGFAEAPWDYRHRSWQASETASPQGCAIKGNVSHSGQIYHMPWSPWYGTVTIDPSRGERWFCSETEAQAAGWRPAATN